MIIAIIIKDTSIKWSPKKNKLQLPLINRWIKYMYIIFSTLFGFIQINQIATDIDIYKIIHTGAKTQSGGINEGFAISEYHGSLYRLVT